MESIWSATAQESQLRKSKLTSHIKTDVLIIGGGMAGILTAFKLKEAGVKVAVAEAKTIGSGVTKNTSAKITAQHGLIYERIIKRYGEYKAKQYYNANSKAIEDFYILSQIYPCDFERKKAFVYANNYHDARALELEEKAYRQLKIPATVCKKLPLPINTTKALSMESQAQFNPLKLLHALANELEIYENTFIADIKRGRAISKTGSISAEHIVLATHFPLINIPGLYFMKLYQHRSYCLALKGAADVNGMYVDIKENGLSFRNYSELLIICGADHKTGKKSGAFAKLRAFAASAYPTAKENYHWATQDTMSLDAVPYIGQHSDRRPNLYIATGFNKWGMTGSMVSARVICDLIIKGKSEYEALYSPKRSMMSKQLLVNGFSAAAGLLSLGSPRCTHMGCKLKWNSAEKTWDCSCHGSRFCKEGHVIDNPAKRRLRF